MGCRIEALFVIRVEIPYNLTALSGVPGNTHEHPLSTPPNPISAAVPAA
jgi:hypothetical protein